MRDYQEPKMVKSDPLHGDTYEHPAFAQIGASRVSGGAHLYASGFNHQHYITITIRRSELHRNLSRDWHMGREELIEVALSEAQWATFVSSLNTGFGVPCTLQHVDRKSMPQLAPPKKTTEQFAGEMKDTMREIQQQLGEIAKQLSEGNIGKRKAQELREGIERCADRLTGNTEFVAKQFGEHMEETIEKARVEVNAYAFAMVNQLGMQALALKGDDRDVSQPPIKLTFAGDAP